jgi:hypothetical protein
MKEAEFTKILLNHFRQLPLVRHIFSLVVFITHHSPNAIKTALNVISISSETA